MVVIMLDLHFATHHMVFVVMVLQGQMYTHGRRDMQRGSNLLVVRTQQRWQTLDAVDITNAMDNIQLPKHPIYSLVPVEEVMSVFDDHIA